MRTEYGEATLPSQVGAAARMPTRRPGVQWNRETVATAIARWHLERGRPPTSKEWVRAGTEHPTSQTVRRVFGEWQLALEAAAANNESLRSHLVTRERAAGTRTGLPKRRPGIRWTPELISYAIRLWYRRHNTLPSPSDWRHAGEDHPSADTVRRVFAGWDAGIADAARRLSDDSQFRRSEDNQGPKTGERGAASSK